MQVWRRQRRGRALSNAWMSALVLACPIDDEAAAAARRRRRAPPNPSINQVAWTLDDNQVLPFCLTAGLHASLYLHSQRSHVLWSQLWPTMRHTLQPRLTLDLKVRLSKRLPHVGCLSAVEIRRVQLSSPGGDGVMLQVLAAISDNTVAVWDAHSGDLMQRLRGHTCGAHVLECHPIHPRLVMSAGYDGQTIVWDLLEGQTLARCAF